MRGWVAESSELNLLRRSRRSMVVVEDVNIVLNTWITFGPCLSQQDVILKTGTGTLDKEFNNNKHC